MLWPYRINDPSENSIIQLEVKSLSSLWKKYRIVYYRSLQYRKNLGLEDGVAISWHDLIPSNSLFIVGIFLLSQA